MKGSALMLLALAVLAMAACGAENFTPLPASTPDLSATVQAAVSAALPTATPSPTTDIEAIVQAAVSAALPTATPSPTPDIEATVMARMEATRAAMPTNLPTPTPTPTATPTPLPTFTPTPTATRRPTSTPRPTPRPRPTATLSRSPLSAMISRVRPAVVKIQTNMGSGSGVIFDTQGQTGFVITNHHVIEGASRVRVTVNDSAAYQGLVLSSDLVRDLAVVSICCGAFQSLSFGDVSMLDHGDAIFALGYPLGITGEATLTQGIVSAIRYDSRRQSDVIQTDAAINPGNSGGPMLSVDGEILGINTFKYSEVGVEGLGFAISSKTVQQRIPFLRTDAPKPTPTPTRAYRPPTPAAGGTYAFGPVSGNLLHDPTDGSVVIEYAGVTLADVILEATLFNPYPGTSNSWDYGFVIREQNNDSDGPFIAVLVTSQRSWEARHRDQTATYSNRIGGGTLGNFNTSAGGRNHLRLVAIGERGWFFVNGEFVSTLDLSPLLGGGDIGVITGAFTGDEVAGAVTRFENFKISRLTRRYGAADGILRSTPGYIAEHSSGVTSRDLVVEANFSRPQGTEWDYGFEIRRTSSGGFEVIGLTDKSWWFHETRDTGSEEYIEMASGYLTHALQQRNHLLVIAIEDSGWLFANGQLAGKLNLSHNQEFGTVSAMGDFYLNHNASPSFDNFKVWVP